MLVVPPVVFLIDVDNTLLDNDAVVDELQEYVKRELGSACRDEYSTILEQLSDELGYRDYLGALQRLRVRHMHDIRLLELSLLMQEYPFAERLFPGALDVLTHLRSWGPTVILSDGDVVLQPRKVQRSGIWQAVEGRVLIYVHKEMELDNVARQYPAEHYVLVDDKLQILTSVKRAWGKRVTTIFPRQGHYAHDPRLLAANPPADITIAHIGDLLKFDCESLWINRNLSSS